MQNRLNYIYQTARRQGFILQLHTKLYGNTGRRQGPQKTAAAFLKYKAFDILS